MVNYASGRFAQAICDRCGQQFRYNAMSREPGTRFFVCDRCNDRGFNLLRHPQNGPFPVTPDPQALLNARPDYVEVSAVEVTAWLSQLTGVADG